MRWRLRLAQEAAVGAGYARMTGDGDGAKPPSTLWSHTRILLGKNLKLKRQQYLIPTKLLKVPLPLSATVEFILPLAIVILLTYIKTLTDIDVFPEGWGGDVPQGVLDVNTQCENGLEYRWIRATQPDQDRTSSCRPYTEVVKEVEPFFRLLTHLHALVRSSKRTVDGSHSSSHTNRYRVFGRSTSRSRWPPSR